jgi:hypothetical protein
MPSPVSQNMVSLVLCLSIGRCFSKVMNVRMWEHSTVFFFFLEMAKFTTPTPLLISCEFSFLIFCLKISSPPTLAMKSPNRHRVGIAHTLALSYRLVGPDSIPGSSFFLVFVFCCFCVCCCFPVFCILYSIYCSSLRSLEVAFPPHDSSDADSNPAEVVEF